ncbi:hypothetical protein ACFUJU_33440 [Streptomyces sp. NPDC057235]|uniref:hypothetical protein n=1 Tax=Streptomyces sp. NPDC057235 TaxID=3346058 RepID=UPI00362C7B42
MRFDDRPGGGRIMLFGTEIHGRGTGNWDALDDIILTPKGLVSPTAEADARPPAPAPPPSPAPDGREIVTITRRTAPDPRRDDPVHELLRHLDVDNDTPGKITAAVARIRTLLETDLHPDDANRLRFALARCQRRMEEHTRRRQNVMQQLRQKPTVGLYHLAVELMRDDPDISQEERDLIDALAARMERLHAERHAEEERKRQEAEQERREGWRRQEARRAETARRASEEERAERAAVAEQAAIEQARQARAEKVKALALAVRGALKKAARENRLTTWSELRDKIGLRQLGHLDREDKLALLALVEADTAPGEPLWSALLVQDGDSAGLSLYRDICRLLGRPLPVDAPALADQLHTEHHRLHHPW